MKREIDLIDVGFDSGAMAYAQIIIRLKTKNTDTNQVYPAEFYCRRCDQTRGWFFTLHAIATIVFDSVYLQANLKRVGAR